MFSVKYYFLSERELELSKKLSKLVFKNLNIYISLIIYI